MCSLYPPKMSVVIFFTFFSLFFILEQNQWLTTQNTCRVGSFFACLWRMGIACVPHLPQKIFSHFLCEGLCHGIGHFIGLSHLIGLYHSHGIGHFIDLGLSLKIFKSRSRSLSRSKSPDRSKSLSRSKTKKLSRSWVIFKTLINC